ncbi:MAG: hypothetical protein KDC52_12660, partial [Ignavibacteriae bacterium]|nr:hypothetical protein [Ignavibacteriota bacterium]
LNRKDQKRIEAEKRQKQHLLTKDLKTKVKNCEDDIEIFERLKSNLEKDMMKEEVYSNPTLTKQNKIDYEKVKTQLEKAIEDWTTFSEELEKITKEIESEVS